MAQDAVEVIAVHYAPLPAVIDPLTAMHPDTPVVHADLGTNGVLHVTSSRAIWRRHPLSRSGGTPAIPGATSGPAPMETRGVVADYHPRTIG